MSRERRPARNFFLNEQHELSREERSGRGSVPNLAPINWEVRQGALSTSLREVEKQLGKSRDPVRSYRYYMQVDAEPEIQKISKSKKRDVPKYSEPVDYTSAQHSRAISRLGLDVLDVTSQGNAIVHVTRDGLERLSSLASRVSSLGRLEQSRWALVREFSVIPVSQRVDRSWLDGLARGQLSDAIIELQPLLKRAEADELIRAIAALVAGTKDQQLRTAGTDFSGRMWLRGHLLPRVIGQLATSFFSIQSIHAPLQTPIALASRKSSSAQRRKKAASSPSASPTPAPRLPAIGVLDGGVPDDHIVLSAYRRGTFQHPECLGGWIGKHGSLVTSRLVFGKLDFHQGMDETPRGQAKFLDIRVAETSATISDKAVVNAIEQCVNTYADVRVFNLSFSDRRPLAEYDEVERREKLRITQDLDNLAFARDILLVVAAGNSEPGQVPTHPYPSNHEDPDWGLGHWACSFNALTCGSFVDVLSPSGVAAHVGAPSPFCKVGPGIESAPIPDLSAPGGDVLASYHGGHGLGVFACSEEGYWEDYSGTSFAAPVLALQCAKAIESLKRACPTGTKPYAATAKAFLVLTATAFELPLQYQELASRTLGFGEASAVGLESPSSDAAVFIWQGMLESQKDLVKLTIPLPYDWILEATEPVLDLVVAWDTPVNAALQNAYASRDVKVRLRISPDARAINSRRSSTAAVPGYPLRRRQFDLGRTVKRLDEQGEIIGDDWILEVFYEQLSEYCAGLDFTPEQRVGVAFALRDIGANPTSPQSAIQSLAVAETMVRLSEQSIPVRAPIVITTR